jgi:hypothetical protein
MVVLVKWSPPLFMQTNKAVESLVSVQKPPVYLWLLDWFPGMAGSCGCKKSCRFVQTRSAFAFLNEGADWFTLLCSF